MNMCIYVQIDSQKKNENSSVNLKRKRAYNHKS